MAAQYAMRTIRCQSPMNDFLPFAIVGEDLLHRAAPVLGARAGRAGASADHGDHGHPRPCLPYDYYADRPVDTVGLARTASLIDGIRAEATNSLLLDNGDFLQGNPMGDYMAYERGMSEGDMHPMIAAMNTLGFDASTLGNHEFNYGLDFLMNSVAGAEFPVVCANVATEMAPAPTDDTTLVRPT
jgi:2',3'-cyclic-nucleotide 2'-phosphodiesterase (5'-nucleotidase family)